METITILKTNRSEYAIKEASKQSITVRELIDYLADNCDLDSRIVFSNDNGYTYGYITERVVDTECVEDEQEEDDELTRDDMINDIRQAIKKNNGKPIKVGCVWLDEHADAEVISVGHDDNNGMLCATLSNHEIVYLANLSDNEIDDIWFEGTQVRR